MTVRKNVDVGHKLVVSNHFHQSLFLLGPCLVNHHTQTNRLHDLQKEDGLHAANKITDKQVYFENHKMRVNLAAQTLSRSVSVALRTIRDLGYSQFKDCEATAEFIEVIQLVIIEPSTCFFFFN